MSSAKGISVVIPAYGSCEHLEALVEALLNGTVQPCEIIISHSGEANPCKRFSGLQPMVRVIHQSERLFAGAARNRGVAVAKSEIIAFIDADVSPEKDWLLRLVDALLDNPERFVVGSVGCATSGGYWGMTNWICEFSEMLPWRSSRVQSGGASCNMIVFRKNFSAAGGFPEAHQPGEDTVLFLKLAKLGLQLWFESSAKVYHHNVVGFTKLAKHQYRLGYHSALVRQQFPIRGSSATKFWPLILLLWLPRLGLITKRVLEAGWKNVPLAVLYFPALIVATWCWAAGFFSRVRNPETFKD